MLRFYTYAVRNPYDSKNYANSFECHASTIVPEIFGVHVLELINIVMFSKFMNALRIQGRAELF